MTGPLNEIEIARAEFRRRSNIEAILCIEAERRAEKARKLVKLPRVRPGPNHAMKMNGSSSLVHRREPIE